MSPHQARGAHCLADLFDVRAQLLSDGARLEAVLRCAAEAAGAQVLFGRFHSFGSGLGVTGVVLLAESHISIHTWPEVGFAAVDIFMCGAAEPAQALAALLKALEPATYRIRTIERGMGVGGQTTSLRESLVSSPNRAPLTLTEASLGDAGSGASGHTAC